MTRLIDADALKNKKHFTKEQALKIALNTKAPFSSHDTQYVFNTAQIVEMLNLAATAAITNAPTVQQSEPFGYFKAEPFGWTDCAETDEGAIALYEAAPAVQRELVIDCKTCANKGVVNGISQETFCEHCIHGTSWKRNYYEPLPAAPKE